MVLRTMVGCRTSRPRRFVQDEQVAENRMLVRGCRRSIVKETDGNVAAHLQGLSVISHLDKDLAHDAAARLGRHVVAGE